MRITISDDLGEQLISQLKGRQTLDGEIEQRLTATLHAPGARVVLSLEELDRIAQQISTGLPIRTKADLLQAVGSIGRVSIQNCRLVFTPSQLLQIEDRAKKAGETPERFIGMIAAKVVSDVFQVAPADQGVFYTPGFEDADSVDADADADSVDAAADSDPR